MPRIAFGLLGAVAPLAPGLVSASYQRLALENPDECATNEWVVPGTRGPKSVSRRAVRGAGGGTTG